MPKTALLLTLAAAEVGRPERAERGVLMTVCGARDSVRVVPMIVDLQKVGACWPESMTLEKPLTAEFIEFSNRLENCLRVGQVAKRHWHGPTVRIVGSL